MVSLGLIWTHAQTMLCSLIWKFGSQFVIHCACQILIKHDKNHVQNVGDTTCPIMKYTPRSKKIQCIQPPPTIWLFNIAMENHPF
jgi:hypothetical protein